MLNNIKKLRSQTTMSQREFAKYFEMPIGTLQRWEQGHMSPAPYVPKMMEKILKLEGKIIFNEEVN